MFGIIFFFGIFLYNFVFDCFILIIMDSPLARSVLFIFVFAFLASPLGFEAAHIGLFASTGGYSHDIMMRRLADQLVTFTSGGHRVTWIQIRVYRFNRSLTSSDAFFPSDAILYDASSNKSKATLRDFQQRMWTNSVPYDANSFDGSGFKTLMQLHKHHIDGCFNALRDAIFMERIRKLKLDLLVTDYILNECALRFSDLLDVNLVYLSNYPILSSYAVDIGLSSNPSFVPAVISLESSNMNFFHRCSNSLLYVFLWATRQWFDYEANRAVRNAMGNRCFTKRDSKVRYRRVLAFSTPFEMFADTSRPLARNVHYFGCDHCVNDEWNDAQNESASKIVKLATSSDGIILVTFGTVTKGNQIPLVQLQRLTKSFAKFPSYTFIWQLDVSADYFQQNVLHLGDMRMPPNVHLFPWLPLKRLLMDDRTVLLITHGGMSTCSEALYSGVPILGIALQGDQGYNLQRTVDRGIGEMIPASGLSEHAMSEKLSKMIGGIHRYKLAASFLRAMLREHRALYKQPPSSFWISWLARHFSQGRNATAAAISIERFLTLRYSANWFCYYSLDIFAVPVFLIAILVVYTDSRRRHLRR